VLAGESPEPVDLTESDTSGGPGRTQVDAIAQFWRERE
jgi:hypothetical protein